jgi:hypothetical protein
MKSYAFVRHNVPVTKKYFKPTSHATANGGTNGELQNGGAEGVERRKPPNGDVESPAGPFPDFSNFLYFMFAPTLVYRDSYPR